MEYVEGQTLESMFRAGRLPLDTGVGYIKQMLSALGYAHQQGVVHRDVTPANVLVTAGGQVKLTDFGLSKSYGDSLLTNCGEVLGSLPYSGSGAVKGTTQPDRRSDLYSVGAILYEHLTGQKPFGATRRLAPMHYRFRGRACSRPARSNPASLLSGTRFCAAPWQEIQRTAINRPRSFWTRSLSLTSPLVRRSLHCRSADWGSAAILRVWRWRSSLCRHSPNFAKWRPLPHHGRGFTSLLRALRPI